MSGGPMTESEHSPTPSNRSWSPGGGGGGGRGERDEHGSCDSSGSCDSGGSVGRKGGQVSRGGRQHRTARQPPLPPKSPHSSRSPHSPQLGEDIDFLKHHGVELDILLAAEIRSRQLSIPASQVLICHGWLSPQRYFRLLARHLELRFVSGIDGRWPQADTLPGPTELAKFSQLALVPSDISDNGVAMDRTQLALAPPRQWLPLLRRLLATDPDARSRIVIAPPSTIRTGYVKSLQPLLMQRARDRLATKRPALCARRTFTLAQSLAAFACLVALFGALVVDAFVILLGLHLVAPVAYFAIAGLRLSAWRHIGQKEVDTRWPARDETALPTYSVLVALYQEANQLEPLVAALVRLQWPLEKLEFKLICEADDHDTIAACRSATDGPLSGLFEIIEVPNAFPRTKPKALNYGLPLSTGELVVVYDAEDRPHPQQLQQAFETFAQGPDELACLQASLVIDNHQDGWLARLFAIEYSALFDGLLPSLADRKLPLPLGGTSNHFKRRALEEVGAWDPYNVTEDADLGMRLARAGYHCATIDTPTLEEAPVHLNVWFSQRTRWFKGWYQTWLVHMRHPRQLHRELSAPGFVTFQLMTLGMAVSALTHPFMLVSLVSSGSRLSASASDTWQVWLFGLDLVTVATGYGAFVLLSWRTLKRRNLRHLRRGLWTLPIYWMLLSVAAWRAVWQLIFNPHLWEKTPHGTGQ